MASTAAAQAVLHSEIVEIEAKMATFEAIRSGLQRSLLGLRELELELEDERECLSISLLHILLADGAELTDKIWDKLIGEGIRERIAIQDERKKGRAITTSSRRRKGPSFVPSEHDSLPTEVAFMVRSSLLPSSLISVLLFVDGCAVLYVSAAEGLTMVILPRHRRSMVTLDPSPRWTSRNRTVCVSQRVEMRACDCGTCRVARSWDSFVVIVVRLPSARPPSSCSTDIGHR